jgi:hypothetical protein
MSDEEKIVAKKKYIPKPPKKLLTMKVSDDEKIRWKKIAEIEGVSLSELIRSYLNKHEPRKPKTFKVADPDLIRQLNGLGNNLNQISRKLSYKNKLENILTLRRIEKVLQRIADAYRIF